MATKPMIAADSSEISVAPKSKPPMSVIILKHRSRVLTQVMSVAPKVSCAVVQCKADVYWYLDDDDEN